MSLLNNNLIEQFDDGVNEYYTNKIVNFFKKNCWEYFNDERAKIKVGDNVFKHYSMEEVITEPKAYSLYYSMGYSGGHLIFQLRIFRIIETNTNLNFLKSRTTRLQLREKHNNHQYCTKFIDMEDIL